MMDYGYHMGYGGFYMWILFIIILVLAVYLIVRNNGGSQLVRKEDTPLEIAKKRYARGEITKEEFQEIKKDLLE